MLEAVVSRRAPGCAQPQIPAALAGARGAPIAAAVKHPFHRDYIATRLTSKVAVIPSDSKITYHQPSHA